MAIHIIMDRVTNLFESRSWPKISLRDKVCYCFVLFSLLDQNWIQKVNIKVKNYR